MCKKFSRLIADLMRLAQWEPLDPANVPLDFKMVYDNHTKLLPVDDAALYQRYGFTPAMINFTEEHFK